MPDYERAMLAFLKLADLSQIKQQLQGRDRFLILAAAAACRAGWPEIAQRCRDHVVTNNRSHLLSHFATMADALRDEEFQIFLNRLEHFCTYERAEHLLRELHVEWDMGAGGSNATGMATEGSTTNDDSVSAGEFATRVLTQDHWQTKSETDRESH